MVRIEDVAAVLLSSARDLLSSWLPNGRFVGREFQVGSLRGEPGGSLSVNIANGKWCDFASGDKGGDLVSLYAAIHKISQKEAANELAIQFGLNTGDAVHRRAVIADAKAKAKKSTPFEYLPPEGKCDHEHWILGTPSMVWEYRTQAGDLVGYTCRYEKEDGSKEIWPQAYGTKNGKTRWHWQAFQQPRCLYNAPALNNANALVLIVEGEKCADFMAARLPAEKVAVISWPGGGKAVHLADWSSLRGRSVVISPDADAPGFKTAREIAAILTDLGCSVRFVLPPTGAPDGWDLADSDLTADTARDWLKAHVAADLPEFSPAAGEQMDDEAESVPAIPPEPPPHTEIPYAPEPDFEEESASDGQPFRCLGYDKELYYYFAAGKKHIVALSPSAHTKNNLFQLADLAFWVHSFPKSRSGDFDMDAAVNYMMRGCEKRGIFDTESIRGRGAWFDRGNIAVHLGNVVIINGHTYDPAEVNSRYIYEAAMPMQADLSTPLANRQANRFVEFCEMMPWENPISGKLAAGWCVVAHIGGALDWRPHIWIVGRRGSGKTWVMNNVVKRVMGGNHVLLMGGSTEAGIRQQLGVDSIPVLYDEAEGEDKGTHQSIQRVLGLMRGSSSDTGAKIAKGTPGGKALKYLIRSAFALSSINANLVQASDKSRVTVLELAKGYNRHTFAEIKAVEREVMTDEFVNRFYARAIWLAPVIRKNASTFADAVRDELGEQRAGDQIGTLLAGVYSLYSDKEISPADAVAWVKKQNWSETKHEINGETDEATLWSHLLQQKVRVKGDQPGQDDDVPVGMLIDISRGDKISQSFTQSRAAETLSRNGIKVEGQGVYVSNTNPQLKKLLAGTSFEVNWGRVLRRLPGAYSSDGPIYFGFKGSESRAVYIPFDD